MQPDFNVLKNPDAVGLRRQAPANNVQDEKVELKHLVWFPSIHTCSYENVLLLLVIKLPNFQMSHVAAQPGPHVSPTTWQSWQFDLSLELPAFSTADNLCPVYLAFLKNAQDNR